MLQQCSKCGYICPGMIAEVMEHVKDKHNNEATTFYNWWGDWSLVRTIQPLPGNSGETYDSDQRQVRRS